jgi:hypothetical protein
LAYEDPVYHDPNDEFEGSADDVLKKLGIQPHHFGMGYSIGKMEADAPKYPDETLKDPTLVHAPAPTESSPITGAIPELPTAPSAPAAPKPVESPKPAAPEPGNLVNTAPTTPAAPEEKPSTGISSPLRPPSPTMQRTMADTDNAQKEYERLINTGSGIDQIKRPFLRGLARAGDIAGSALFPGVMMGIPGTDLHHRELVDIQAGRVQRGLNQQKEEAETQKEQVAANDKEPSPEQQAFNDYLKTMSPSEAFKKVMQDKLGAKPEKLTPAQAAFDEYIKKGLSPIDAFRKVQETLTEVKPDTEAQDNQRYEALMAKKYDGKALTREETAWVRAYERRKQLGPLASGSQADKRQGERENATVTRDARREIQKAQTQYQNSKEAGDALNGFIKLAQNGNKEAAATVPLEGTLRIVTSQGVKRINRTEVEGITGAGSLFDMIQGKVQKLTKGQPIPPDLLNDFKELNDVLIQGAYKNYSDTYENTKGLYPEVDFTKFTKLKPPGEEGQPQQERSIKKADLEALALKHNMSYADAKKDAEAHGIKVIE